MVHTVFNVVAPVAPHDVAEVRSRLTAHGPDTQLPVRVDVKTLPMLHFASMVVFDSQEFPGSTTRSMAYLVLQCCIDGPMGEFLDALVFLDAEQKDPLGNVFALCSDRGNGSLRDYLDGHKCKPDLLHIGVPGMRLLHIHAGENLRKELDTELDAIVAAGGANDDPLALMEELRTRVRVPATATVHSHLTTTGWVEDPTNLWRSRLWHWSTLALLLVVGALIVVGPAAAAWARWNFGAGIGVAVLEYGLYRLLTKWYFGSNRASIELDAGHRKALMELEDRRVLNHMCTFTLMQDSAARRAANWIALHLFNIAYRTIFTDVTPGRLDGLPTIHFAHWTHVPLLSATGAPTRHRALMFLSNYDGSWEAYLDDFIALLAAGVATIWASCVGFRFPMHGPVFKAYARNGMTRWSNWYAGEPDLTVLNIHNNDQIRKGLLRRPETPEEARLWLSRFGSLKSGHEFIGESDGNLQAGDVQGVVLNGYGHLKHSAHVPLHIIDAAAAREWLQTLYPRIVDGRHIPDRSKRVPCAVNIAFTHRGLAKLGLPAAACDAFPLAFREGMAPKQHEHRSRALGDTGDSAPTRWRWGGERTTQPCVDVLLLLYAGSKPELDRLKDETYDRPLVAKKYGVVVGATIEGEMLPPPGTGRLSAFPAEHFGFADGISQPELEGTWHGARSQRASPNDILKPGEFVLGYPGEDGLMSGGVPLDASEDADTVLPQFNGSARVRDFGRNGSFLVARQLHQDVARFRAETTAWGGAHGPHGLAARMVGRSKAGLPLTGPVSSTSPNDFTYADDPHGFKCPIGAHIRRANPRGSIGDDFDASLVATRRRRLLRRGRTYGAGLPDGAADDAGNRGVMFICLNADLERQFEFVQQNWINNPVFSGVYAETDPSVGERRTQVGLTVQAEGIRDRVMNLASFVTVRGGDYFFLPGMRALRYLATRPPAAAAANGSQATVPAAVRAQVVPMPAPSSRATASVQGLASALPALSRLVALRFQILAGLVLIAFGLLGAGVDNRIGPSLYIAAHWSGVVVVTLLASLAASIVMLTARLPLTYGDRLGLGPGRWLGPIRWPAVLLFQVLALPVVIATLHWTAVDAAWRAGAQSNTGEYLARLDRLLAPALAGFGLAALLLALTARAGQFAFVTRLKLRATRWALARVPRSIGTGYVDYENRRLLPGHGRLLALAVVLAVLYLAGAVVLSPIWAWSRTLSEQVPSIAYLLTPVLAASLVLPVAAFFFDRYRVPVLVIGAALLVLMMRMQSDHYFPVGPARLPNGSTPRQALAAAMSKHPSSTRTVVVIGEGYGLISSAWTARVLTGLTDDAASGDRFTAGLRLVSTASGASVGALYFLDGYTPGGFARDRRSAIRVSAGMPSSGEGGWGFAYPDRLRVVMPLLVPRRVDRGWATEQAWRGRLASPDATLSGWRQDTTDGWRPATAFTTTLVETGERAVISSYDAGGPSATGGYDVNMVTAARLSATFPYISPPSRPDIGDGRPPRPHVIDGGLTDNSGWGAAREWLQAVRDDLASDQVLLIEIRSVPRVDRAVPVGVESWLEELTSPLLGVVNARNRDAERVQRDIDGFVRTWSPGSIRRVTFDLNDASVPLSWNLGRADTTRLAGAWKRNNANRLVVCRFLSEAPTQCQ